MRNLKLVIAKEILDYAAEWFNNTEQLSPSITLIDHALLVRDI